MKIPTYDSNLSPTVTTPSPKSGASPVGEALQGVGSILGQVSESLTRAEVLRQVNEADLKRKELFYKISESARLDTNPEGFDDRRKSELTEGLPSVTEGLKHPLAKQQFEPYLAKNVMDFEYGLHMEGVKKLNDDLIAKTKEGIEDPEKGYLQQYYAEPDPAKKKEIIDTMVLSIKGLGDAGAITRPQEKDWVYNMLDRLGEGQFNYDLGAAQSVEDLEAIGELVKSDYYTKDPKDKLGYEKTIKTSINNLVRQEEELRKDTIQANEDNITDLYTQIYQVDDIRGQRQLTEILRQKINEDREKGLTTALFTNRMVKLLMSEGAIKEPDEIAKNIKRVELLEWKSDLVDRQNSIRFWADIKPAKEELQKFQFEVFEAIKGKYIDKGLFNTLLDVGKKDNTLAKAFFDSPEFSTGMKDLRNYADLFPSEKKAKVKADIYSSLMRKFDEGKPAKDAVKEIVNESLYNEMRERKEEKIDLKEDINSETQLQDLLKPKVKTKLNPKIVSRIKEARDSGMADDKIKKQLEEVGLNPEDYGL